MPIRSRDSFPLWDQDNIEKKMLQLAVLVLKLLTGVQSINISFIFITSFGQYGLNSSGVVPAVDMALADINNRSDLLPGYSLTYDQVKDSQVCTTHYPPMHVEKLNPWCTRVLAIVCSRAPARKMAITPDFNLNWQRHKYNATSYPFESYI